jgi:DNA recombination protein RmuC
MMALCTKVKLNKGFVMILIWAAIGLFLGFIIGMLVSNFYQKKEKLNLQANLAQLEQENQKLNFKSEFLGQELESRKTLAQDLSRELEELFRIKSSEVLEEKTKQLLVLADDNFKRESTSQGEILKKRDEVFRQELKFLFEQIQTYQNTLGSFEKEREKTLGSVESQIKNIIDSNTMLGQQTQSLKDALARPNVRGRWGELQLKNCIELAGMSDFCDVDFQQEFKEDEKVFRPDMIVKLPSGKRIIVDAKTPMEFYLKYIDETNEQLKVQYLDQHAKRLKTHIRELGSKAYNEAVGAESLDYVVMFLPNESFLFAAIEAQKDIIEYALANKVLITTPPSLVALLRAIHMGWGEYKVTENAKLIYDYSKELQKRLMTFAKGFLSVEQQLEKSLETFRTAKNSFQTRVLSQARRIESLEDLSLKPGAANFSNSGESSEVVNLEDSDESSASDSL